MKTWRIGLLIVASVFLLTAHPSYGADDWSFVLLPGGDVTGAPGATIGWGFTIANQSDNLWLELLALNQATVSSDLGTIETLIFSASISDGILDPGEILTAFYVTGTQGLAEVIIDINALIGQSDSGSFSLDAAWWDHDPLTGGSALRDAGSESAPYSVTVIAVSEPSIWPVLISALAALAIIGPLSLRSLRSSMSFLAERRTGMFTMIRLALVFIAAATLPLFAAGEALAGGGLLPTIPFGWVLNTSKDVTAEIALDPNGPVVPGLIGATPTGTLGTITIDRKHYAPATAVFQVQPDSTLGGLALGCDLSVTGSRFVEVAPGEPGLPMGSPGSSNWLAPDTATALFTQVGVTLVDQSLQVVMIPGITRVVSQQCASFPASYPNPSGNTGFLILNVEIGFWAAPGTQTPK